MAFWYFVAYAMQAVGSGMIIGNTLRFFGF